MPAREHPAKVATPLEALSGLVVQPSAPDEGVSEMEALEEVTTLPPESSTLTTGWALKATPLVELPGEVVKTSWVADPVASEKVGLEVAPAQPGRSGAQAVARAGRAGDLAPGEGGHAARGVERVGGAAQCARRGGERNGGARGGDHVAAGVFDLDHRLGAEGHTVGRVARRGGEDQLGGRPGGQ